MSISNPALQHYPFLAEMAGDSYYPPHLVAKGQQLLAALCASIEAQAPKDLDALYALTHATTEQFNSLAEAFDEQGSEIETVARECIGADVAAIATAYGFDADIEELISPRDW
ncbi:hypothetical protein JFV28_11975 [Pseudomonas sp. TH05]|uniref:DUF5713 family protein n=1 Tax=unclassified Pseudomonas TaxID=196821 RepID=UPI000996B6A9|nr:MULTISPECIES: DUF5713 family protein [unclassified Pseudomonas]MBK5540520.1 hypothetical protein [Pseudomonas sp. TH07]MBK5556581.1 hypothetical protein [Pseudomonas sp. TH05]OOV92048.1 hypothetical protein MF4836_25355 [Pseudomonas sp. MF4836]